MRCDSPAISETVHVILQDLPSQLKPETKDLDFDQKGYKLVLLRAALRIQHLAFQISSLKVIWWLQKHFVPTETRMGSMGPTLELLEVAIFGHRHDLGSSLMRGINAFFWDTLGESDGK